MVAPADIPDNGIDTVIPDIWAVIPDIWDIPDIGIPDIWTGAMVAIAMGGMGAWVIGIGIEVIVWVGIKLGIGMWS